jgi:hypothetical protein
MLIPPSNFARSAELIADTGEDNLYRFINRLTLYWHQYVQYLKEKDAFGIRYFYPYLEEFSPKEKELIDNINRDYNRGYKSGAFRPYSGKYAQEARSNNPEYHNLDLSDMPQFSFKEIGFTEKVVGTLPGLLIMFLYNLLFLFLSHLSLNTYDPRRAQ